MSWDHTREPCVGLWASLCGPTPSPTARSNCVPVLPFSLAKLVCVTGCNIPELEADLQNRDTEGFYPTLIKGTDKISARPRTHRAPKLTIPQDPILFPLYKWRICQVECLCHFPEINKKKMDTMEATCGLATGVTFQGKVKIGLNCLAAWFEVRG